jgi:hypothetical protein
VSLLERGALAHLDRLTVQHTGHEHYYGRVYPVEQRRHETPCIKPRL